MEHERKALALEQNAIRSTETVLTLLKQLEREAYQTQRPAFEEIAADFVKRNNEHNQRVAEYHARWGLTPPDQPKLLYGSMTKEEAEAAVARVRRVHEHEEQ